MSQQTNVKSADVKKQISIYCIVLKYEYRDGETECSESKYCGNSKESCFEAISKLLSPCRAVLPESVSEVSFDITAYSPDSYSRGAGPDLLCSDVVRFKLRNDNEGVSTE